MSQLDKLKARICAKPKDFTWDELVKLLAAYGFESLKAKRRAVGGSFTIRLRR
jgi:hypothetical protein